MLHLYVLIYNLQMVNMIVLMKVEVSHANQHTISNVIVYISTIIHTVTIYFPNDARNPFHVLLQLIHTALICEYFKEDRAHTNHKLAWYQLLPTVLLLMCNILITLQTATHLYLCDISSTYNLYYGLVYAWCSLSSQTISHPKEKWEV